MPTEVVRVHSTETLNGTVHRPDGFVIESGTVTRAAVFDHGDFAVISYSAPNQFRPEILHESIVLNERRRIFVPDSEKHYMPLVKKITFTPKEKKP